MLYLSLTMISCAADITAVNNEAPQQLAISSDLLIDATSEDAWIYLDLDGFLIDPLCDTSCRGTSAVEIRDWDLAFQRYKIKSNGGVSGVGGVEVAVIKDRKYDEVTVAPTAGYDVDQEDSEADEDTVPDYVFNQAEPWYQYDFVSHVLTPKGFVYVVRTDEDQHFKIMINDYYNDVGDGGHLEIMVESLPAP